LFGNAGNDILLEGGMVTETFAKAPLFVI